MSLVLIWIIPDIEKKKYDEYIRQLELLYRIEEVKKYSNVIEAINNIMTVKFEETIIIVEGGLYDDLINAIKEKIKDIYIAPKIIVITKNIQTFKYNHKEYENDNYIFYSFGGVVDNFDGIKNFLQEFRTIKPEPNGEVQLTFEYIDCKEKLMLPLFFKSLIENISNNNLEQFTNSIYNEYSEKNAKIKDLLKQIKTMKNIPIEILSKYYARLYTIESEFYNDINRDLRSNKLEKYLPFIKTLYEGLKLQSLPLAPKDCELFRGSNISKGEIQKIKTYLIKKNEGLPGSIVFSKSFLSFSQNKTIAKGFLRNDKNFPPVLFVINKYNNIDYNLSTHCALDKISIYGIEEEVLFFPFSSFEIESITEKIEDNKNIYEIRLSYLNKYLIDIEKDINLVLNDKILPNTNFKDELIKSNLVKKEKIEKMSNKELHKEFKEYEKEIQQAKIKNNVIKGDINQQNIKNNIIIGEIKIEEETKNKRTQIINSFENVRRTNKFKKDPRDNEYKNEKDIIENIKIKINGAFQTEFSYFHEFNKEGIYKIEYIFKKDLTKTNHMFYYCSSLISLDFSNFNTKNVTNMKNMFYGCSSLSNLKLSNINTQNVIDMSGLFCNCRNLMDLKLLNFDTHNIIDMSNMFYHCENLNNLDLSNFNTGNVQNMSSMFNHCKKLKSLDLSNFNTKKVEYMDSMFNGCKSLINLDLSNFNTESVKDMSNMFQNCYSLQKDNIRTQDDALLIHFI